ncbi:MAG: hypothetical protein H7Z42_19525 [Roseiflexaceae bacterium]|nr:hypothetical protein [Roseiflexaceae bacterium]
MNIPAIGIGLTCAIILLMRDWRFTVPALLINYLCLGWMLTQQQFIAPDLSFGGAQVSTTVVVKLITGLAAALILAITAITFSREYNTEDLDEFSLAELRRAARRAQRTIEPFRMSDYVVPFWSLVLAAAAALLLPRLYPVAQPYAVDFAWYWLALTGLFTLVTANDVLKVGLGLLLCVESVDLVYTAVAGRVQVFPLALLSLLTLVLALAVAYISGLLYGRLKTLDLAELYRR